MHQQVSEHQLVRAGLAQLMVLASEDIGSLKLQVLFLQSQLAMTLQQ